MVHSPFLLSTLLLVLNPGDAGSDITARLSAVNVVEEDDRSRVELTLTEAVSCTVKRIDGTNLLVAEVSGCLPEQGLGYRSVDGRHVRSVRVLGQERTTLVELALSEPDLEYRYFVVKNDPRLVIDVMERRGANRTVKETGSADGAPSSGASAVKATTEQSAGKAEEAAKKETKKPAAKPRTSETKKASSKVSAEAARNAEIDKLIKRADKAIEDGEVVRGLSYLEVAATTMRTITDRQELFLKAARLGREHGCHAQAIRFYERTLRLSLTDSLKFHVSREYGESLAALGRGEDALGAWEMALSKASDPVDEALVRRTRAEYLLALGRDTDAVGDLAVIARHGRTPSEEIYAGYRLGAIHAALGESEEAIEAFESIPSRVPADADSVTRYFVRAALVRRADLLYRSEQFDASLPIYQRVVSLWPGSDDACWALFQSANAERRSGRFTEAIGHYEELEARWPQSRWASMARWGKDEAVWLRAQEGETAEASQAQPSAIDVEAG